MAKHTAGTAAYMGYDSEGRYKVFDLEPGGKLPAGFTNTPPEGKHPNQNGGKACLPVPDAPGEAAKGSPEPETQTLTGTVTGTVSAPRSHTIDPPDTTAGRRTR